MQLSLLGWPPLLSHGLAFIIGTLVLQRSDVSWKLPGGRILIPVDRAGRLEEENGRWKETQKLSVLARSGEAWCRTADEDVKLWKAPGRGGNLYVIWPSGANTAARLQQILQKKAVLTADPKAFAFCGAETQSSAPSGGIHYD